MVHHALVPSSSLPQPMHCLPGAHTPGKHHMTNLTSQTICHCAAKPQWWVVARGPQDGSLSLQLASCCPKIPILRDSSSFANELSFLDDEE